ncbi:metal-dependent hydrolase [Stieleria varia]|uniref:Metal-dependent hydrolase n=1 Tax=Stieleria varia TaxID=2528005 RepID=A0A5C6ARI6_9BACT|nr:metal-dependent hydrolase [Stieleria varia]TWU00754.1 hypothetical protein Pla52n_41230 [Stieleria varia]
MADFKTHITVSTVGGIAYGYWGAATQGMTVENGMLAGGLCAVSGMLPDLDSDGGIPLRETSMFAAAVVPILMIDRFRDYGLSRESMALAAMIIYLGIRFVVVEFFKRFTVHRGMWHSLPAAAAAGLIAYLLMPSQSEAVRAYKSFAVVLGFIIHLILDEIWAVEVGVGRLRTKKSFGTALKFFGPNATANAFVYLMVIGLSYAAWHDDGICKRLKEQERSWIFGPTQYTAPVEPPPFTMPQFAQPAPPYYDPNSWTR